MSSYDLLPFIVLVSIVIAAPSLTFIGALHDRVLLSNVHMPEQVMSASEIIPPLEVKSPCTSTENDAWPSSVFKTPLL